MHHQLPRKVPDHPVAVAFPAAAVAAAAAAAGKKRLLNRPDFALWQWHNDTGPLQSAPNDKV